MATSHTFLQTRDWSDSVNPWKDNSQQYNCVADWDTPLNGSNPGEFNTVSQAHHGYVLHHLMGSPADPYTAYVKMDVTKDGGSILIDVETKSLVGTPATRIYTFKVNQIADWEDGFEKFRVSSLTTGFWPLDDDKYPIIPFSDEWYNDDEETPDGDPYTGSIGVGWTLDMKQFSPGKRLPLELVRYLTSKQNSFKVAQGG